MLMQSKLTKGCMVIKSQKTDSIKTQTLKKNSKLLVLLIPEDPLACKKH